MARKTRKLSREDREVWQRVTQTLKPIRREAAVSLPPPKGQPEPAPAPRPIPAVPEFRIAQPQRKPETRIDLAPDPMHGLADRAPRIDARTNERLRRGKLAPEARIDLHGMTAEHAHLALRGFLLGAHDRGKRVVLVITGKGKSGPDTPFDSPARRGVLRNAVPQWLALPPLSAIVLQIAPAHQRHGGGGAYYVYLRRRR